MEPKKPANETPQIELLYRDIFLQMNELNELRPYKAAVEEILEALEGDKRTVNGNRVKLIIEKHIKQMAPGEQPGAKR